MISDDIFDNGVYCIIKNNCLHFLNRLWWRVYGHGLGLTPSGFAPHRSRFTRLQTPENYCLALFKGHHESHVGMYIDGNILHFNNNGVQFVPLHMVSIHYFSVRFYREKTHCN